MRESFPAERWCVEVVRQGRAGERRVLASVAGDRDAAVRTFNTLSRRPSSPPTRVELVHVTIDAQGRELSRSVVRSGGES